MQEPLVSVIIVHHTGFEILKSCLDSLFNTEYSNFKVILVDNGSDDGSVKSVEELFRGKLNVVRSGVNLGFIGGNNLALKQLDEDSKYVVLLNNDTVVDRFWLKMLVEVAEKDKTVGALMPKLLSLREPTYFEYSGACGGLLDVYGVPFCRGRIFDLAEEDRGQYDTTVEVFWASGAALLLRTSALKKIGFLDELLYAHMEEIDLCWRLRLQGFKVLCVPQSIVYHLGGGTQLKDKFYLKQRNNLIVMLKNYSLHSLVRYLIGRIILDALSTIFFLLKKEKERCLYVFKSYLSILTNLKRIWSSRLRVQTLRKVGDSDILNAMCKGNISIQYYLLRRRRFTQIQGLPHKLDYYLKAGHRAG
ncbi:MAG: glycosyltransferase family 2 protein [Nitrososphaerales archaeon]